MQIYLNDAQILSVHLLETRKPEDENNERNTEQDRTTDIVD